MDSQTWRQIGRGALAGAVAGTALAVMGMRIGVNGALQPAPTRIARRSSAPFEPPFDAPEAPPTHREEARTLITQAATGAALGALYGFLRSRAGRAESAVESGLYGMLLSTLGLGAWLTPLGLLTGSDEREVEAGTEDWSSHDDWRRDDIHPPYEDQPPYDPTTPYDVF